MDRHWVNLSEIMFPHLSKEGPCHEDRKGVRGQHGATGVPYGIPYQLTVGRVGRHGEYIALIDPQTCYPQLTVIGWHLGVEEENITSVFTLLVLSFESYV